MSVAPAIAADADTLCADFTSLAVGGDSSLVTLAADDGPRGERVDPPAENQRIGEFTLLRRLGEGGMGVVFAAWSHKLARRVAIKLPTRTLDDEVRARIVREAQSLAQVDHPNVVQVYEIGEEDGALFIAMELVEGVTLKKWQSEAPHGWRELVHMYIQAGQGLAAAHRQGLIHRDFKPSNTLVDREGRVRLIDFGLARMRDSRDLASTVDDHGRDDPSGPEFILSSRCGTPRYMAPELHETGSVVDARSDQYSFCLALWEALFDELPDPARATPSGSSRAPAWLVRVLRRGLAYRREDRYPAMDLLLADLARGLQPRRRPVGALAALSAALATGAGALLAHDTAPACESPAALADALWPAEQRAALRAAGSSAMSVETWFSAHVAEWAHARAATCAGDGLLAAGEPSSSAPDYRLRAEQCLGERRRALTGVALALADATAAGWDANRWDARLALWDRALAPAADCVDPVYLNQTIDTPARSDLLEIAWLEDHLTRGAALARAGDPAAAEPLLHQARAAADADPWRRARADLELGIAAFARGDEASARRRFETAAADADAAGDDFLAVDAWRWLIFVDAARGPDPSAALRLVPLAEGKLRRIHQAEGPRMVDLELSAAWAELRRGDLDAAHARLARALQRTTGVDEALAARVLRHHAEVAHQRGQSLAAVDFSRQALALQLRLDGPAARSVTETRQSLARYELAAGLLQAADADLQVVLAEDHPDPRERASRDLLLATLRYTQGDLPAARIAAERAAADFDRVSDPLSGRADRIALAKLRGDLALETGDPDAARRHYHDGLALAGATELPEARDNLLAMRVGLADADRRSGDLQGAGEAIERVLADLARGPVDPTFAAYALGTAAEIDLARGNRSRAETRCRRALDRLPAGDPLAPALQDLLAQIRG